MSTADILSPTVSHRTPAGPVTTHVSDAIEKATAIKKQNKNTEANERKHGSSRDLKTGCQRHQNKPVNSDGGPVVDVLLYFQF